jgi:hypothetical protein
MGTYKDWILVALVAVFWGAYKPLRMVISGRKPSDGGFWDSADVVPSVFFGFFIGIMIAFHWGAFRWPLVLITVAAFFASVKAMSSKLPKTPF